MVSLLALKPRRVILPDLENGDVVERRPKRPQASESGHSMVLQLIRGGNCAKYIFNVLKRKLCGNALSLVVCPCTFLSLKLPCTIAYSFAVCCWIFHVHQVLADVCVHKHSNLEHRQCHTRPFREWKTGTTSWTFTSRMSITSKTSNSWAVGLLKGRYS